eukprot:scaffold11145_cov104-Skeletonema_marinoi.AAC.3
MIRKESWTGDWYLSCSLHRSLREILSRSVTLSLFYFQHQHASTNHPHPHLFSVPLWLRWSARWGGDLIAAGTITTQSSHLSRQRKNIFQTNNNKTRAPNWAPYACARADLALALEGGLADIFAKPVSVSVSVRRIYYSIVAVATDTSTTFPFCSIEI